MVTAFCPCGEWGITGWREWREVSTNSSVCISERPHGKFSK
jgi:hypothetical protein